MGEVNKTPEAASRPALAEKHTLANHPAGPPPATHASLARSLARWVQRARSEGLDDRSIEGLLRETLHADAVEEIA